MKAYNPDGTDKWDLHADPYAFIVPGISVGPDGNIYSVAVERIGAFSLTPQGTLRWSKPEPYDARNCLWAKRQDNSLLRIVTVSVWGEPIAREAKCVCTVKTTGHSRVYREAMRIFILGVA